MYDIYTARCVCMWATNIAVNMVETVCFDAHRHDRNENEPLQEYTEFLWGHKYATEMVLQDQCMGFWPVSGMNN